MDTNAGLPSVPGERSLSIAEAAAFYGVSEKKIRKRIKDGTLRAVQRPAGEGFEWRVETSIEAAPDQAAGADLLQEIPPDSTNAAPPAGLQGAPVQVGWDPALLKVLDILERSNEQHAVQVERLQSEQTRLQEENRRLYGQVALYQTQLAVAEERFRMLEARPTEQTRQQHAALVTRLAPARRYLAWWRRRLRGS